MLARVTKFCCLPNELRFPVPTIGIPEPPFHLIAPPKPDQPANPVSRGCYRQSQTALQASGGDRANVHHKPRLLSGNSSDYISDDLVDWRINDACGTSAAQDDLRHNLRRGCPDPHTT